MTLVFFKWLAFASQGFFVGCTMSFFLLFLLYPTLTGRRPHEMIRTFEALSPFQAIAMAGWLLAALSVRYLEDGFLAWSFSTQWQQLDMASSATLVGLFVSAFSLELWTAEPLRRCIAREIPWDDGVTFRRSLRNTKLHLGLNTLLILAWYGYQSFFF